MFKIFSLDSSETRENSWGSLITKLGWTVICLQLAQTDLLMIPR